jgi:hypothetical protein
MAAFESAAERWCRRCSPPRAKSLDAVPLGRAV